MALLVGDVGAAERIRRHIRMDEVAVGGTRAEHTAELADELARLGRLRRGRALRIQVAVLPGAAKPTNFVPFFVEIVTEPRAVSFSFWTSAGSRFLGPLAVAPPEALVRPTVSAMSVSPARAHITRRDTVMTLPWSELLIRRAANPLTSGPTAQHARPTTKRQVACT